MGAKKKPNKQNKQLDDLIYRIDLARKSAVEKERPNFYQEAIWELQNCWDECQMDATTLATIMEKWYDLGRNSK